MLVSNIDWDDYVGRVAIGRITSGTVKKGDTVWLHQSDGSCISGKVTRMFEYSGLSTTDSVIGVAGNIVGVAGFENVNIGETLGGSADTEPLPSWRLILLPFPWNFPSTTGLSEGATARM